LEHTVTDLVLAARCPVAYARRRVLGLPQAPSGAARRGTLVHRWLEERAWALQEGADPMLVPRPWQAAALLPLLPVDPGRAAAVVDADAGADAAVDDPPEPVGSDAEADRLADRYLATPYASRVPAAAELPLVLTIGGQYVRGTADLLFVAADGGADADWEVVDLKTGPPPADDAAWLQLESYALAIADGGRPLDRATLTFLALGGRRVSVSSRPARPRARIVADLRAALEATRRPATCPGCPWCR
jgi:DNA helicase-2/ATP-dependent DNA helicase PcrA